MRKVLMVLSMLLLSVGLTLAAPVRLVKYDETTKEVTVKEGKKGNEVEKVYKLSDKTKFYVGEKELQAEKALKRLVGEKAVKGFDLEAEGDKATKVKFYEAKKKKDN